MGQFFNDVYGGYGEVQLVFPVRGEGGMLELRMDEAGGAELFNVSFQRRLDGAAAGAGLGRRITAVL
jgi:hypothetical protein